jgi:hypothetical protein
VPIQLRDQNLHNFARRANMMRDHSASTARQPVAKAIGRFLQRFPGATAMSPGQ